MYLGPVKKHRQGHILPGQSTTRKKKYYKWQFSVRQNSCKIDKTESHDYFLNDDIKIQRSANDLCVKNA